MKRRPLLLALATLFSTTLHAQDIGSGADSSAKAAQSNGWQNWAFTGAAVLTATAGVIAVSVSSGSQAH